MNFESEKLLQPQVGPHEVNLTTSNATSGWASPKTEELATSCRSKASQKGKLQFAVGPPIPDDELALLEWNDLSYFVEAKPPKNFTWGREIDESLKQSFLDDQLDTNIDAENRRKGLP